MMGIITIIISAVNSFPALQVKVGHVGDELMVCVECDLPSHLAVLFLFIPPPPPTVSGAKIQIGFEMKAAEMRITSEEAQTVRLSVLPGDIICSRNRVHELA